jgi:hypothetical protein
MTCSGDGQCASGSYCDGGDCVAKKATGRSCSGGGQCMSGNCVDGFCCENSCSGGCQACSRAKNGREDGRCLPVEEGDDPDNDCSESSESSCGNDGACDGRGACRKHGTDVRCGNPSCGGGRETGERRCDGRGRCGAGDSRSCEGFRCDGDRCANRSCTVGEAGGSCADGNFCTDGDTCAPRLDAGRNCSFSQRDQCRNGLSCQTDARGQSVCCPNCGNGVCLAGECKLAPDSPCARDSQCASNNCQKLLVCAVDRAVSCSGSRTSNDCEASLGVPSECVQEETGTCGS